jgi:hypothetical protein
MGSNGAYASGNLANNNTGTLQNGVIVNIKIT